MYFIVIELDNGFAVASVTSDADPAEVAASQGGTLVDPGPFRDLEEANDAIAALQPEEQRDR